MRATMRRLPLLVLAFVLAAPAAAQTLDRSRAASAITLGYMSRYLNTPFATLARYSALLSVSAVEWV
jgi:hypothetical protein